MIVELNGNSARVARAAAFRFLENTSGAKSLTDPSPRKYRLSPEAEKIERERMRAKVKGTKKMRAAILRVLDGWRDAIVGAVSKVRESTAADVDDALNAAAAAGVLTPEQAQAFIAQIDGAISSMDPNELATVISEIQTELYNAGVQSASAEVGMSFDIPPEGALDALHAATLTFSQDVVDRELAAIKDALMNGIATGESIPDLTQRLKDVFDDGMHITDASGAIVRVVPSDSWAEMVARTETARAMNTAVFRTYHAAGVKQIQWVAAEDERTCPVCADLDGEVVIFGDEFEPGIEAPPDPHPSCRCTTVSVRE